MDINYVQNADHQKTAREILEQISEAVLSDTPRRGMHRFKILVCALLVWYASRMKDPESCTLIEVAGGLAGRSDALRNLAEKALTPAQWARIARYAAQYAPDDLGLAALMENAGTSGTMGSVQENMARLSVRMLDIQPDERVADLLCGSGSELIAAALRKPAASYYGYEKDPEEAALGAALCRLIDSEIHIETADAFELAQKGELGTFDKIFAANPLTRRYDADLLESGQNLIDSGISLVPGLPKNPDFDWLYNALIHAHVKPAGKAVVAMMNSALLGKRTAACRSCFVQEGLIEDVIALPPGLRLSARFGTAMLVLNKGNSEVRMVDASGIGSQHGGIAGLTDEDIEAIAKECEIDSTISRKVSAEELADNDYALSPRRYLVDLSAFPATVPLKSVIKRIVRGMPLSRNRINGAITSEPTDAQYVQISDIQHGIIDDDLMYLKGFDPEKHQSYTVRDGCLVIGRSGEDKIAVADVPDGRTIIASGNLFVVELDKDRMDPYYLLAYLSSETGQTALRSVTAGEALPTLSREELERLPVPLPPLSQQKEIAEKCRNATKRIAETKKHLAQAVHVLGHLFDDAPAEDTSPKPSA